MSSPGTEYVRIKENDGREYIEDDNGGIEGVVVYGNKLNLLPITDAGLKKFADEWFALSSPEDGSILGYVEKSGVDPLPEYRKTESEYFMANRDDPELYILPNGANKAGAGKKYSLSDYGYSLAKGEVVTSAGTREENGKTWLMLEFSTAEMEGGIGLRYAWSPADNFTALAGYEPDNSRADERIIPTRMRFDEFPWRSGDDYYGDYKEDPLDYLPVTENLRRSITLRGFEISAARRGNNGVYVQIDDMADCYGNSGEYQADFITTDIFLHSFHLLFDHMLQKFERTYLAPRLEESMKSAVAELDKLRSEFSSAEAYEVYETARDMFGVVLLMLDDKAVISKRADEEAKRIIAAEDVTESSITGAKLDYTLFKPRGHYTISPEFERYFRAMSWLGSAELPLFGENGLPIAKNAAASALISLVLESQGDKWNAFEEPVDFLVGAPATGGSKIYRELAKGVFGTLGKSTASELSDAAKVTGFAGKVKDTVPGPVTQSRPEGDKNVTDFGGRPPVFRVSGKRFTYDAYVMNTLTSPRVGTDENPRNLPEGTDVMAVLGSKAANDMAGKNSGFKNYAENAKKLKEGIDKYLADDGTVYSLWIAALKSGFENSGSSQFFYRSPAWQWKKLSTQSASWAELKHDTILYVEQTGAEMGDGGGNYMAGPFEPPYPRGYVEPDPQTFDALLSAVARLREFIVKFSIEGGDERDEKEGRSYSSRLEEFAELLTTARDIAKKEAAGEPVTLEDYENIKRLSRSFGAQLLLPGENVPDHEQLKMALVADAATDYFDGGVLEIASGKPRRIYVFVNDASGGARITRGYVFSYYEFVRPLGDGRMTDEEWKSLVYDDSRADELKKYHPSWYENLAK
jgi:hypothetical protein